jgi:hypothetical protein
MMPTIINTGNGDRAIAYPQARNKTSKPAFGNWIVNAATNPAGENAGGGKPNTLPHELMHILLNSPHRPIGEPITALFRSPTDTNKWVSSTKRIGPFSDPNPDVVGKTDTTTIRASAEKLPIPTP